MDTHCHLDAPEFDADRPEVMARAAQAGVGMIVVPAVTPGTFATAREAAHACGGAYALGIHPLYVRRVPDDALALLESHLQTWLDDPRLVAVGEVASTLAHELNQPLGALSSFATGLLNRLHAGSISPQDSVPVVTRMASLAEKAGRIIQRVNAIARRREISLQRLDLVPVLQRMVPAGVDTTDPVWVEADELLLEHLVNNLLGNAQESAAQGSTPAQVQVRVQADAARQVAVLSVADSGAGVHEEDREHVFEAFYSTKDGGMGMGLAICRSVIEVHHGGMQASTNVWHGARLSFTLPLIDAATRSDDKDSPT